MKKKHPKIHFQIFKYVISHCELLDIDRHDLLNVAGVDESFLKKKVSYVSLEIFEKIFVYIYENLDSKKTLLDLFKQSDTVSIGPLELLMSLSENLDEAIMSYYKYREINGDLEKFIEFDVVESDIVLRWRCSPQDSYLMRSVAECQTAWWGNFIKLLSYGENKYIKYLSYEHEYSNFEVQEHYGNFFECPVFFNQEETVLVFSKSALKKPLKTANKELYLLIENYIKSVLITQKDEEKIKDNVKALISIQLEKGRVSREIIAKEMGITVRTLTRKLGAEGSSYSSILEEVRVGIAKKYLEHSSHRVTYISKALGFFRSSAFITWFKSIVGMTPKKYREYHKDSSSFSI
ncbi:AraC family transcriptional regulator [Acinetobacter colistiniresistens]|uniref:AraC family transcriptional regulator n=1 Tax=Acinetobacter colistiniresistens TaxID=280145 RepID=UPI0013A68421|nr:response regulator transcription factor [Acinetobacter colistiniresistens]